MEIHDFMAWYLIKQWIHLLGVALSYTQGEFYLHLTSNSII